jgi:hypothetical protein
MTRYQRISLLFAVVLGMLGLALVTSTVLADSQPAPVLPVTVAATGAVPSVAGLSDAQVIDAQEFEAVSDIAQRITAYVTVGEDGVPRLADVTAEQIGVDPTFLENFRQAMSFANEAIEQAHITVNADLTVVAPGASLIRSRTVGPLVPESNAIKAQGVPGDDGGDAIQWQGWTYPQGAMFYNTYSDYWSYYYNRYYVLCNSMAAYLGYPWLSGNLIYFYSYNSSYFYNYLYPDYGMYFYLPYSGSCPNYNPCYCCGLSYRPMYVWVRTYVYTQPCGCYRYTWAWQGYWGRY